MIKNLYSKLQMNKYYGKVINYASNWPNTFYLTFLFAEHVFTNSKNISKSNIIIPSYFLLILEKVLETVIFNGLLFEYVPSKIIRNILYILFNIENVDSFKTCLNLFVYNSIMDISREKNSLLKLVINNVTYMTVLFYIAKYIFE